MNEGHFEAFYCALAPRLRRYLARLCDSDAVAEELVQEAFFRFLRIRFEGGEEERTRYLFTIATNLARNRWSRMRIHEPLEAAPPQHARDPAARLDLLSALGRLTPRERALVWLTCAEGYEHRDVAQVLGIGRASVRVLLFRARRKLARLLENES